MTTADAESTSTETADEQSASHLEPLGRSECVLRLIAHGVGRVSVARVDRPSICPVNYFVDGDAIVFRTRRGSDLFAATFDAPAAFEIDGTDSMYHEGWSVLVVGQASHVQDPEEISRLEAARLTAWAGEHRDSFVRIELEEVTGRHIHHRAPTTAGSTAPTGGGT
jgi:hypothetical protein